MELQVFAPFMVLVAIAAVLIGIDARLYREPLGKKVCRAGVIAKSLYAVAGIGAGFFATRLLSNGFDPSKIVLIGMTVVAAAWGGGMLIDAFGRRIEWDQRQLEVRSFWRTRRSYFWSELTGLTHSGPTSFWRMHFADGSSFCFLNVLDSSEDLLDAITAQLAPGDYDAEAEEAEI